MPPLASIGDLPKLAWWMEPDSFVGATDVGSCTDKSGSGNTLTSSGANRPVRQAAVLNGYDGVKVVAASNQYLTRDHDVFFTGKAFTFGLVVRVDAVVADSNIMSYDDVETTAGGFTVRMNGGKYSVLHNAVAFQDGDDITTGTFRILTYRFPGAALGSYRSARVDVALAGATTNYTIPGATVGLTLGSRNHAFTDPTSCTYVAGFLCGQYLTSAQVMAVENLWKAKYPSLA